MVRARELRCVFYGLYFFSTDFVVVLGVDLERALLLLSIYFSACFLVGVLVLAGDFEVAFFAGLALFLIDAFESDLLIVDDFAGV